MYRSGQRRNSFSALIIRGFCISRFSLSPICLPLVFRGYTICRSSRRDEAIEVSSSVISKDVKGNLHIIQFYVKKMETRINSFLQRQRIPSHFSAALQPAAKDECRCYGCWCKGCRSWEHKIKSCFPIYQNLA